MRPCFMQNCFKKILCVCVCNVCVTCVCMCVCMYCVCMCFYRQLPARSMMKEEFKALSILQKALAYANEANSKVYTTCDVEDTCVVLCVLLSSCVCVCKTQCLSISH